MKHLRIPALSLLVLLVLFGNTYAQSIPYPDFFIVRGAGGRALPQGENDLNPTTPGIITNPSHGFIGSIFAMAIIFSPYAGYTGLDFYVYGYCGTTPHELCTNRATVYLFIIGEGSEEYGYSCPVVGQPVNVATGNVWLEQKDYALPGVGENIAINRFYNSQSQFSGLFGLGWTTKYDERVDELGDLMLKFTASDGRGIFYTRETTSGPFHPATAGFHDELVKNRNTGSEVGRFVVGPAGDTMIEPVGGSTVAAGKGGMDTHTLYPNGSNYQRLNPFGHGNDPRPHGHGHLIGTGPYTKGQGASIDVTGRVVPWNSDEAHWWKQ